MKAKITEMLEYQQYHPRITIVSVNPKEDTTEMESHMSHNLHYVGLPRVLVTRLLIGPDFRRVFGGLM